MIHLETTNSSAQAVLVSFLSTVLPDSWSVVEGQDNRVPEPVGDFAVITSIMRERLSTNVVAWADVAFIGSISGTVLTVSSVRFGSILVAARPPLWGVGVAPCTIAAQLTGSAGGSGTYRLAGTFGQTVSARQMAAGNLKLLQPTKVTWQVDFHSPDVGGSSDAAQTFATVWRDAVATDFFDAAGVRVAPLYCEEPRQTPFINSEQQYETRWTVDAHAQVNAVVDWPMQFMDDAKVTFFLSLPRPVPLALLTEDGFALETEDGRVLELETAG